MKKKDTDKSYILMISIFIGSLMIIISSYMYYKNIRERVIAKEQEQLLTISQSVSRSIERFFNYKSENLKSIVENELFKSQFKNYILSKGKGVNFSSLEDYYAIQGDDINRLELLNLDSTRIEYYPKERKSNYPKLKEDIKILLNMKTSIVGNVYLDHGNFYIRVLEPVWHNEQIKGILAMEIKLDTIYQNLVKPIKVGKKGYASVKDHNGVLLMHPKEEDLGQNVIEARKKEFPNYDWSELEEILQKQIQGESGVGMYHSIWYDDKNRHRVKKFSAYSPVRVGNQFWIVTVSMDYLEVANFLKSGIYQFITFNFIIVLLFVACMFYIYKIKKDKKQLEVEANLLKQVNNLNKELEKDLEERKTLEKELIRNKEKYECIFHSGSDCIFVLNVDDNNLSTEFLEVNDKACSSLGYDKVSLLKMSYLNISQNGNEEKFKNMVETLKENQVIFFEDNLIASNGKAIPVEMSAHLFRLEEQLKLILISRDVTNRKIQEEALKRSEARFRKIIHQVATEISDISVDLYEENESNNTYYWEIENKNRIALELEKINIKLEEMFQKEVDENKKKEALMIYQSRLAGMGEMIANIAHQWRQPLSGLGLIFSNIEDAYHYGELTEEYLQKLMEKSKNLICRMSQTIDDFRYFFNPKSEETQFSIENNIKSTIQFLEEHLRLNQIELKMDIVEDAMVYGYANQFSQVIFNVLQNAIDALIEKRFHERKINIRTYRDGQSQIVEIKDNGGGMDSSIIEHAFEPYFTTKNKSKGTGLGLYMSKVIIEKNFQGKIALYNNNGLLVAIKVPRNGVKKNDNAK